MPHVILKFSAHTIVIRIHVYSQVMRPFIKYTLCIVTYTLRIVDYILYKLYISRVFSKDDNDLSERYFYKSSKIADEKQCRASFIILDQCFDKNPVLGFNPD